MKLRRFFSRLFFIITNNKFKNMVLNKPIYIFHHIPKCGGTSVRKALAKRFIILSDYRPINDSFYIKNKINIKKINIEYLHS
ncbi:MAG: hypothetical protein DRJ01_12415 [Bacteroidetes bacterium]|nr:MAG: hypothetical protein DRJ01_12415 [Bacteroidota bacterium]